MGTGVQPGDAPPNPNSKGSNLTDQPNAPAGRNWLFQAFVTIRGFFKRQSRLDRALALAALVIAIVTLGLDWDLHRVAGRIHSNTDSIQHDTTTLQDSTADVQKSISEFKDYAQTGFVDTFPGDIPKIIDAIRGTCTSLDIMTDTPGYGIYSSPNFFRKYQESVNDLANGDYVETKCGPNDRPKGNHPTVNILVFSPRERNRMNTEEQFISDSFVERLRTASEKEKFKQFYQLQHRVVEQFRDHHADSFLDNPDSFIKELLKKDAKAYCDFLQILNNAETQAEEHLDPGINVKYASHHYNLYLWIQDGKNVVFGFQYRPHPSPGIKSTVTATTVAFRTNAQEMVKMFKAIFDQEWSSATPTGAEPIEPATDCSKY